MAARVLELELTGGIDPIWGVENYDWLLILVRHHREPIGWVAVGNASRDPVVSVEHVRKALEEQLCWALAQALLKKKIGTKSYSTHAAPPISIVVCTRDRTDLLKGCLQALQAIDYPSYEIVAVDNAPSTDETARLAASLPVRYVREDRPGLDWARNRGISEAQYSLIAFTDDDVRPDRDWLQTIAANFSDGEVMAVTGLVAPAELETPAQHTFEFGYGGMGKGFHRRIFRRLDSKHQELLWAHPFGVGANMAFRREIFARVGEFDPALDVGTPSGSGGDLEFLHRLVAAGHTLVYEPRALVWHVHRRSSEGLRRQILDNGRGFGSYLLTCFRNRTVSRPSILSFAVRDWLIGWLLRRLVRPRGFPRRLVITEMIGAMASPFACIAAQRRAKKIALAMSEKVKVKTIHPQIPVRGMEEKPIKLR